MIHSDILAALGRLNAHARDRSTSSGLRRAIYDYKSLAAALLARSGGAAVRLVKWTGKCNRCTDGWYTHWDWTDGHKVRCRDCSGTGQRTLRFCETTLPDGQVWHHPWFTGNGRGYDIAQIAFPGLAPGDGWDYVDGVGAALPWHDVGEWAPNLPGAEIELHELVPLLNLVETWVEATTFDGAGWLARAARVHLSMRKFRGLNGEPSHSYALKLGRAPGGCFVCGTAEDLADFCYGRMTSLFCWSLPVCRQHGTGPEKAPHPTDPPPAQLLTPAIREWMDRHTRIVEVF